MAFPFLSEEGFELGTKGHFDTETDTGSRLDFPHYSDLVRDGRVKVAPYRGAYCMRVDLATSTADAYLQETGSWDTALDGAIHFRFMLYVSPDITMANSDEFAIFLLLSGVSDAEAGIFVNYTTANGLRIGTGEGSASSFLPLTTGVWHCVELSATIDDGASDDGTLDLYLDGTAATQVTALNQAAITSGLIGVFAQDAGTTKGVVLFDDVIADDARIYPPSRRFPTDMLLTKSGHVAVGPCIIENASLLSGAATDCVLSIYDTDTGSTLDASNIVLELKNVTASDIVDPAGMPIRLERGCYVSMTGTNPRAMIKLGWAPAYGSDGAIRTYGSKRKALPNNI